MHKPNARGPGSSAKGGVAAFGIAAFAIVCCAGLPLLAAVAGGVALGTVLGVGAGLVAVLLLVGAVVMRARRRRACKAPSSNLHPHDAGASPQPRSRETAP